MRRARIAILISGRGTNMEALLKASASGELSADVTFVGSDNANAGGLATAKALGIAAHVFSYKEMGRKTAENAIAEYVEKTESDIIVLAGFMKILSPEFVRRFPRRILNIHPALLPLFPGAHAIRDAWEAGVSESGVTVHIVDEEVDHGEILEQCAVDREENDTIETFEAKIHAVEHRIYKHALQTFIESEIL
ncbi:MAG: phosphoribosylglycinamide formyltransferase [Synergistes sp.]|nr:phosphoribosylglycinamide formyltransferase [Synergistes sp.]